MRMHSRLLHEALQKEETRVIVVEIEVELKKPGADEEFYAADFETLGQEDEDKNEEVISEDEAPLLGGSDGEHDEKLSPYDHPGEDGPHLCQQPARLEVEGDLTEVITEEEALPPDNSDGEHDEEPSPYEHPGKDEPRIGQQPARREIEGDLTGMTSEEEVLPPDSSDGMDGMMRNRRRTSIRMRIGPACASSWYSWRSMENS
jgi:hypothetical protein